MIYHITCSAAWAEAQAQGQYTADSLASEGFIHCSKPEQVIATANRYYAGQHGLLLLAISPAEVNSEIRFENTSGGAELYPHIYGPLNLAAVLAALPFEPDPDGSFSHIPQIIALIPANNECEHIQGVVTGALQHLPVWVVDDGSTDPTAELAEAAGARVFRQTPNQGKGAALRVGFHQALAEGLEAVITLDGDGQHDPGEIPAFLEVYARQKPGLIIGMRDYRQIPLFRRMTNTIGRAMISWALGEYIPDNQSGYRLIARPMLEILADNPEQGFELEVDMITLCLKRKLGLAWVPIRTIYAGQASHIRKLRHLVHYFRITWKAWREMHDKSS